MTSDANSTSVLPPAAHALAGSIGGAFATWMFYPLELLRVEIQAQGNKTSSTDKNDADGRKDANGKLKSIDSRTESDVECFVRLYKKQALYRGASSMVTTMLVSSFITFYALEVTRKSLSLLKKGNHQQRQRGLKQIKQLQNHLKFLEYILPKSKMGTSLLASTLTGIINVFLTTPLWNGTRRIMESGVSISSENSPKKSLREPSLWEMMQHIANDEGVLQLWHGTWSSLLLVSNPAIQYFLYEQIRVWVLGIKNDRQHRRQLAHGHRDDGHNKILQLTAVEAFAFGAFAKTIATVVTYPLQLAQVLIRLRKNEVKLNSLIPKEKQTEEQRALKEYSGIVDCLYQQYIRGGFTSLFQGMNSKMLQTVGQAAFTFLTYEQTLKLVGKVYTST